MTDANEHRRSCPIIETDLPLEPRVNNLEIRCNTFEEKLGELHNDHIELGQSVDKINENLRAIKHIALGGVIVLVALEFGVAGALKALML